MQAHCLDIKKRYPDAKTVFIGPCVAKKDEAANWSQYTDEVLTFEELTNWLNEYFSITGPPAQLPMQADISIKHLCIPPSRISSSTPLQFDTPSNARYVYSGLRSAMVWSTPPVVGNSLARLFSVLSTVLSMVTALLPHLWLTTTEQG